MAKVLIIEDDVDIRNAYAFALTHHGHEVALAANSEEGLKQMQNQAPDVLVLDLLMPGLSGVEFLKQEKIKERFPNTKTLVFSNIDSPRVISEAQGLGVQEYIVKVSTTPTQLVEKIEKLLKK